MPVDATRSVRSPELTAGDDADAMVVVKEGKGRLLLTESNRGR